MKKTLIAVLGMAMIAPMAWAQTNVISQNAVGYVKVTVPANGGLVLVRHDFEALDGSPQALDEVLGTDLEVGTVVYKWDRAAADYDLPGLELQQQFFPPFEKVWTRAGQVTIERGDAFWIQNAPAGAATDVYLLGEVPGSNNGGDTTLVDPIVGFAGFPYPASTLFTSTATSSNAPVGTLVYAWDPVAADWDLPANEKQQQFFPPFDIVWSRPSQVITPGQAYFVDLGTNATFSATENKPYMWP